MTRQDKINVEFQRQIALQNARIDRIDVKLDAFIQEMRNKDNQRAAEMTEIRTALQNVTASGRNLNVVTILGIAALVIAVLMK